MRKLPLNTPTPAHTAQGLAGRSAKHDSAWKHVSGQARYIDDLPLPEGTLHAAVGHSQQAHARVVSMDLDAVRRYPGVIAVVTARDVPGHLDIGPVFPGDPVMADDIVEFIGQPLFAVAATSHEAARKAARLAEVEYEPLEAVVTVSQALDKEFFVRPSQTQLRGNPDQALSQAPHRLTGE